MVAEDVNAPAPELVLDKDQQAGFVAWFKKLPKEDNVVRFFDRKGFYSVHGDNATFVARQFFKTTAVVKNLGSGASLLPSVALNRNTFENTLRVLLLELADNAVELYEGHGSSWRLARSASPGRLHAFEDELAVGSGETADTPVVAAISVAIIEGLRRVGVAYVDAAMRRLGGCEFNDDDQFCHLDTVLVQLGAKECVVPKEAETGPIAADLRRVTRDVLPRCSCLAAVRPKAQFVTRNLEQDVARLVKSGNAEHHRDLLDAPQLSAALAAVIGFAELTGNEAAHGRFTAALYDVGRHMRLDAAAQKALNVLPARGDGGSASFSLYGLMARGRTAMGKRLLKGWLKQPLVAVDEIKARHDLVEAFVTDAEMRETLRNQHLRGLPDVDRLVRKLERKTISLAEMCQLYRVSSKLPSIQDALSAHKGPHAELIKSRYIAPLADAHDTDHLTKFEELLEAAVDLDKIPDEYLICATYDSRLEEVRVEKDAVEREISIAANEAADRLGLVLDKSVKLEWHKVASTRTRCLRITQKEERAVRKQLQASFMVLETRKDGTKFTNKRLKVAASRLQDLSSSYAGIQRELVEQVVRVAHTFVEVWESAVRLLAELDTLLGLADLAVSAPVAYVRPEMLGPEHGELQLKGSRHPCLEAQEGVDFVANDCDMRRGESWFQIITGPNMGGKSTFIRQVGAIVLMAQCGSFVPCDEAKIAVRDCIFARVGAGDCQMRGVSTFMAEMLETAAILKGATERSLVIIDELGRGTSTYDGFGLAWAISEHLMNVVGAPALFATHFHELTAIRGPVGVRNLHVDTAVDAATGKLAMLYRVSEGACDESFGIHVAEYANFPPEVVAQAKQKLAELEGMQQPEATGSGTKKRPADAAGLPPATKQRVQAFVADFSALPLDKMDPKEATKAAKDLFEKLQEAAGSDADLAALLGPVA